MKNLLIPFDSIRIPFDLRDAIANFFDVLGISS